MDETLQGVLLICLGWLLGLLGPAVVDRIKGDRENASGKAAILTELDEVSLKIALSAHYISNHFGSSDRPHLEWLKSVLLSYRGLNCPTSILNSVNTHLEASDEVIELTNKALAAQPWKGIQLQKFPVPILDSRISTLWSLDPIIQMRLIEIRTCLDLLNELVDRSQKLSDLTFSPCSNENHRRILENLDQCYTTYASRAKITIEHIKKFRSEAA